MNLALDEIELPVRLRTECPMTDDEFMSFCRANEPLQFERDANGEIIVMSPTGTKGVRIEGRVFLELANWARTDGRGEAFNSNAGFKLPNSSVRAADAAWVSSRLMSTLSEADVEGFAPICPEFVIEIRSQSDRLPVLQDKMQEWIANGAEVAWLIDPKEKAVTIYRAGQEPECLIEPSSVQGDGPVAGFELVMGRIWG
jgi:Uma2 family endonuclease